MRLRCSAVLPVGFFAALVASLLHQTALTRGENSSEVRALWVQRTSLTSPESIAQLVSDARAAGFNTLLVQVRGRGDAFFSRAIEPRATALGSQPDSFDPLAAVLTAAHNVGLRVHAWINVNLVANVTELPTSQQHIVNRHPEWLMVPRALVHERAMPGRKNAEFIDKLAEYTRSQSLQIEGLYLSPIPEGAVAYTTSIVADLAKRYDVDGVHFDYIRYPTDDFDYSAAALSVFRQSVANDLSKADRVRYDARLHEEPAIYADAFPDRWSEFRRERLTALVGRLRRSIKSYRKQAIVSAAVIPDTRQAFVRRLQDWQRWTGMGLLDVICPMAYTGDVESFRAQIASVRQAVGATPVWAGIGAYRLSSSETVENIETARAAGAHGVVLFSYDNLAGVGTRSGSLSEIGRAFH